MGIDTPKKRKSAAGNQIPGINMPLPDGDIDESDRATAAGYYSRFEVSVPTGPAIPGFTLFGDEDCFTFKRRVGA